MGRALMNPAAGETLSGLTVLVVDDEPDARELVADLLGVKGAVVYQADCPESALEVLEVHTPDVLISDIAMPGADGYWLVRHVRALTDLKSRRIPAIALTAFTRDVDRARALAAGFDRHMPKPLNPAGLVDAVRSMASARPAL